MDQGLGNWALNVLCYLLDVNMKPQFLSGVWQIHLVLLRFQSSFDWSGIIFSRTDTIQILALAQYSRIIITQISPSDRRGYYQTHLWPSDVGDISSILANKSFALNYEQSSYSKTELLLPTNWCYNSSCWREATESQMPWWLAVIWSEHKIQNAFIFTSWVTMRKSVFLEFLWL